MRLTVIGCGYVGLVTGACLAAAGHEVFCTDIDANRIDQLKAGKVPIYEEHLGEVLQQAVREKKIVYTADAGEAIRAGEIISFVSALPPRIPAKLISRRSTTSPGKSPPKPAAQNSSWKRAPFPR